MGQSKEILKRLPEKVRGDIGHALSQVQNGFPPRNTKHLHDPEGAQEIISNHDKNTYRAFYTAKFKGVVFVLHVFQKKSKRDIETPLKEIKLARVRMKDAQKLYNEHLMEK